jgi:hypothetical protein
MKTQNTINTIVNVLGYIFLAGATSSLVFTVYTIISRIF